MAINSSNMDQNWVKMAKTVSLVNVHLQCAIKAYFLLTNCEDLEQTEASATSAENCATILHAFNCTLVTRWHSLPLLNLVPRLFPWLPWFYTQPACLDHSYSPVPLPDTSITAAWTWYLFTERHCNNILRRELLEDKSFDNPVTQH